MTRDYFGDDSHHIWLRFKSVKKENALEFRPVFSVGYCRLTRGAVSSESSESIIIGN